ncbi:Retrovirus-related Pol polyprotein from transposon, partial [Trichinella zimbabwensis]
LVLNLGLTQWIYWQVEVADEDKEKTASTNPFWLYQFQGNCTLRVTLGYTCMVYVDDIIVFSKDASEPLENFDEVFSRLQGAGLKIKPTKCQLFQSDAEQNRKKIMCDQKRDVGFGVGTTAILQQCFLYDRRFTVRTDHGSLTWQRNFKEPEGQVARWLENFAAFDFEQCSQNTSTPCAAVSSMMGKCQKCEYSLIWPAWTAAQLETAQEKGLDIAEIRKWVTSKTFPTRCPPYSSRTLQSLLSKKDQMIVKYGVLFRRRLTAHADHRAGYQFVVPQILRQKILHCLHSGPEGGHLGKKENSVESTSEILLTRPKRRCS